MENINLEDNTKLDELLETYAQLKYKENELKGDIESVKSDIVAILEERKVNKYSNENRSATLSYSSRFKYKDEPKLVKKLNENDTYKQYVITSVDSTNFNNLLKSSESVADEFKDYVTKTVSSTLTVK